MATFLDVGILQYFDVVFAFIFVFAIMFALLQKTKIIGDSVGVNAMIAITSAFIMAMSRTVIQMITFMIPWFVIAIIFFVLLLLIFQVFGAKELDFASAVKDRVLRNALIGVAIVILLASFGVVFGQGFTEQAFDDSEAATTGSTADGDSDSSATSSFQGNIRAILANSKVLGMVVLFGIAIFAVALLTGKEYV